MNEARRSRLEGGFLHRLCLAGATADQREEKEGGGAGPRKPTSLIAFVRKNNEEGALVVGDALSRARGET